jgi:chemotaxis protein methyltransferase CheR
VAASTRTAIGFVEYREPGRFEPKDFAFLRDVLFEETGIHLSDAKRAFVAGRLAKRLRALGLGSFAEYCLRVRSGDDSERTALVEALCTHETRFFRESSHFDYLASNVVPGWLRDAHDRGRSRPIRIWSAGCATGEEAYSVAMTLRSALPEWGSLQLEILATDVSARVLAVAADAVYPISRAGEIPDNYLKAYMRRGRGRWEGQMRVCPEIRAAVRFGRLNLAKTPYDGLDRFDLIFCRNVLIYFDTATRTRVVRSLLAQLAPGGRLMVGHAEGLLTIPSSARLVIPSVYAPLKEAKEP